jgi:hypothetical protein
MPIAIIRESLLKRIELMVDKIENTKTKITRRRKMPKKCHFSFKKVREEGKLKILLIF